MFLHPWIFQARILEWVAISFSRLFSGPRDGTQVSGIAGSLFIWGSHKGSLINKDTLYLNNTPNVSDPGGKEPASHRRICKRYGFNAWVRKTPRRRKWQPASVFLPGDSQGQRSLVGYSP